MEAQLKILLEVKSNRILAALWSLELSFLGVIIWRTRVPASSVSKAFLSENSNAG